MFSLPPNSFNLPPNSFNAPLSLTSFSTAEYNLKSDKIKNNNKNKTNKKQKQKNDGSYEKYSQISMVRQLYESDVYDFK